MDRIDPLNNQTDKETFLSKFPWQDSVLQAEQRELVEELLLEFHDIFAKHIFDNGSNTELKIFLNPEHDLPLYAQCPPTPIHLRDELHVELSLIHF